MTHPLLDLPPFPPSGFAPLADRIGRLMGTTNDVLLIQAEAVVALEAVATSISRPGLRVLNLVTSPYGTLFGTWLTRGGATVTGLSAAAGLPIAAETVAAALSAADYDALALVHAESATGILNPLADIAALARTHGAMLIVDAVASIGGHAFAADTLGVDIGVIGPQKALGGSAGVSAISVSPRAWDRILRPGTDTDSILSLADQKRLWLDQGRPALPGTPSSLEFHALQATLDRVEAEGLSAMEGRHARATRAAHAGLVSLGLEPFVALDKASRLVTTFRPQGDGETLLNSTIEGLSRGVGPAGQGLIRLNHTGLRAQRPAIAAMLAALAAALGRDPRAATDAVDALYDGDASPIPPPSRG